MDIVYDDQGRKITVTVEKSITGECTAIAKFVDRQAMGIGRDMDENKAKVTSVQHLIDCVDNKGKWIDMSNL